MRADECAAVTAADAEVSVIIVNYNGEEFIEQCLSSLMKQTWRSFEVIVVDNGSRDGSVESVRRHFPMVKVLANPRNLGFSVANNQALRVATGRYVVVLNHDTVLERNFLQELLSLADSDQSIGSVGCKIVQLDGTMKYKPAFMRFGFVVPAVRKSTLNSVHFNLANCGCASLYKKHVLDHVGGFDEFLFMDQEDWDIGWRLNMAGYKSAYTPRTTVLHFGGWASVPTTERYARIIRNRLLVHAKNYDMTNLVLRLPLLVVLLGLMHLSRIFANEATLSLTRYKCQYPEEQGNPKREDGAWPRILARTLLGLSGGYTREILVAKRRTYLAFFRGVTGFLRQLRVIFRERYDVQKLRKLPDRAIFSMCTECGMSKGLRSANAQSTERST